MKSLFPKSLLRSAFAAAGLLVLAVTLLALITGTDARATDGTSPAAPAPKAVEQPTEPGKGDVPQISCLIDTTCADGSEIFCTGPGSNCIRGTEPCTFFDCSGSRNYVQCGTTKKVCPCDIGRCKPCSHSTACTPGASCTTQEECGPCGSCEFGEGSVGSCVCLIQASP